MKAMVYSKYGSPEVLALKEVGKPKPKDDEVLIKVQTSSINSWDWDYLVGTFQGRLSGPFRPRYKILGADIAGIVESVGTSVTDFKPGDEVFGDLSGAGPRDWGGFAEYVCASEKILAAKSPKMSFEEAAAIPQAGMLAWQGLCNKKQIKPGQKVLINGAGGAVGTFAIQIAQSLGAEVTGVDSGVKMDMMKSLGADHVIDYKKEDFTNNGIKYDVILDVVGHRSVFHYKRALSPTGIYVMAGGKTRRVLQVIFVGSLITLLSKKRFGILLYIPRREDLLKLNTLFEDGIMKPKIDSIYPLSKLIEAFKHYEKGDFHGKIVITM